MKNFLKRWIIIGISNIGIISAQPADVTVTIDPSKVINPNSKLLLGITFDARTSMRGNTGPVGYYDTLGVMIPQVQSIFGDFPMTTLRYPANAVMTGFDWKKSIGDPNLRPVQNIGGNVPAQRLRFGFDEFMSMTNAKGVQGKDIQIMVTIYPKSAPGLSLIQTAAAIDDPAGSAADWVEYANSPSNGMNWGGGIDWAARRDSNGHSLPYGIEIWNLGNEPWASGECGNDSAGAVKYISYILPMIDSMKARDPSIKITVPATGPVNSAWNKQMLNHPALKGKIYGLSPHFFPDETVVNGSIPLGIANIQKALPAIAESAAAHGLKVIVGDYAHGIPILNGVPIGDPDLAMQWQGANLCADFLMFVSGIKNIERTNFWEYGMTLATWHPIRLNGPGSYTLMPAAALYKKIFPVLLDRSVFVSTVSPAGSDGNNYSVRAGAFSSQDGKNVGVIVVNRDKNNSHSVKVNGLSGYTVNTSRLLSANSLISETITETIVSADSSGNFTLPAMSILLLRYGQSSTSVGEQSVRPGQFMLNQNYPNPFNPATTINFQIALNSFVTLKIYDAVGREVRTLINELKAQGEHSVLFDGSELSGGIYFARLTSGSTSAIKKLVLIK